VLPPWTTGPPTADRPRPTPTESALAQRLTDIDAVSDRLSALENRYHQTANSFQWKLTTTDLTELVTRLDNHKPEPNHDPAQPRAA